jgi:hypothetical protein
MRGSGRFLKIAGFARVAGAANRMNPAGLSTHPDILKVR